MKRAERSARDAMLVRIYEAGASAHECCARGEISYSRLKEILVANEVKLRGHEIGPACPAPKDPSRRQFEIHRRREEGYSLESIGTAYGVTKERIRQILKKTPRETVVLGAQPTEPPEPDTPPERGAYHASLLRRLQLLRDVSSHPRKIVVEREMCRRDPVRFINNWCWTYDPRRAAEDEPAWLPFDLFPRQVEMLQFIQKRLSSAEDGLIEKSRDIGFTWVAAAFALHHWIFVDGFKTIFGSNLERKVDSLGDPDSIFEKIRLMLYRLPPWLQPEGFFAPDHDNFNRLVNPVNQNTITGEAGDNIGRGGRASMLVLDEAAHIERAERVDASSSGAVNCRIWASSVSGMGNLFARKRHGKSLRPDQIFRFHWSDDPRKTPEWATKKKAELSATPWAWAAEYEIDYSASVEGVCIPAKWVEAAIRLPKLLAERGIFYKSNEPAKGGLDIGGGKAESVLIVRRGPVVESPEYWGDPDTTNTAFKALDAAQRRGVAILNFDEVGIGKGVLSTLTLNPVLGVQTCGINTGVAPSMTVWDDEKSSRQKFANLKAEIWWIMREAFRRTYEHVLFLTDPLHEDAHEYELIDLILMPDDAVELQTQLSTVRFFRNDRGRVVMESKVQMAARGVASPDRADALALTFVPDQTVAVIVAPFIASGPVPDAWAPRW